MPQRFAPINLDSQLQESWALRNTFTYGTHNRAWDGPRSHDCFGDISSRRPQGNQWPPHPGLVMPTRYFLNEIFRVSYEILQDFASCSTLCEFIWNLTGNQYKPTRSQPRRRWTGWPSTPVYVVATPLLPAIPRYHHRAGTDPPCIPVDGLRSPQNRIEPASPPTFHG